MEKMFYLAAKVGHVEDVKEILRSNPTLNVNWRNEIHFGNTALNTACENDDVAIVSILLAHPAIDVDLKDVYGNTPFNCACYQGNTSCARLLLKDSRVKVDEPSNGGYTPLFWAASNGHLDTIRWWIASGREMDLGKPGVYRTDAIGKATENGKTEVVALLERFKESPERTRYKVRLELGMVDEMAAEIFALVVFVSDGLLRVTHGTKSAAAVRFFCIASQLPLELQMVLCYRVKGSSKEILQGKVSEVAFKELARKI